MPTPNPLLLIIAIAAACSHPAADHPGLDASNIDASSADATIDAPGSVDPAVDGSLAVTTTDVTIPGKLAGATLAATTFVPVGGATPRPLVVISPGFQMARAQYTSYARHLATWGYAVVLTDYSDQSFFPDHQKLADDVTAVIDWSLARVALAADPARIATAGHSLGGKISVFAATQDARIRAVVGWDPVDSSNPSVAPDKMVNLTAAVAVVGETTDAAGGGMPCAPAGDNFEAFYTASHSPAIQLTIAGADHMDFVDDQSCALCGFCTAGTATPEMIHTATRRATVAWLRRRLDGDPTMDHWLDAPPGSALTVATK